MQSVVVSDQILNSSKLITSKNEEDPFKIDGARVVTTFSHYKSLENFQDTQGQLPPGDSPWSDLTEFQTNTRSDGCPRYLQK